MEFGKSLKPFELEMLSRYFDFKIFEHLKIGHFSNKVLSINTIKLLKNQFQQTVTDATDNFLIPKYV